MASSLPSKMKAIVIDENTAQVKEVPLPKIRPTYLLAKVEAIALNPTVIITTTTTLVGP
jgi:NADPH:quinone reductase-like Zn-dependent oxidoreductase